jgi:hypothetical protein
MKTIQAVTIWDKGTNKQASILNAYAINVTLNTSATFYYALLSANEDGSQGEVLTQGNLSMTGEAYTDWTVDNYAWDWVAEQLNLTITGDYNPPVPTTTTTTTTEELSTTTTTTTIALK